MATIYEIDPIAWQVFATKLLDSLPGAGKTERKQWLADHTGIGISTIGNWTGNNGGSGGKPHLDNLEHVARVLDISLPNLISIIQLGGEPPVPRAQKITQVMILNLAELKQVEVPMTAKSLAGLTQSQVFEAASKLMLLASAMS
jgi:hypothetical protein